MTCWISPEAYDELDEKQRQEVTQALISNFESLLKPKKEEKDAKEEECSK